MEDQPSSCALLSACGLAQRGAVRVPTGSDPLTRRRYCRDNWAACARYQVACHQMPVPDDLCPDDRERATRMVGESPGPRVRVGLGTSDLADPGLAGERAASLATGQLGSESVALVLVYASVRYDLVQLLAGVRSVTGTAPLVGASSSGQFHAGHLTEAGRGVAVLVMTAGPYRFGTGLATGLRADPFSCGHLLATRARASAETLAEPSRHSALLALPCGVNVDHQRFVNGVYRVAGAAVPIVGGAASDDRRMSETYVLYGDQAYSDAAVGVWIGSDTPVRVVRGHGWRPRGLPLAITSVEGALVRTIDGRPAVEVFNQQLSQAKACNDLGATGPDPSPPEPIVRLAEAGRCLGIIEPDGERTLRGVFADTGGAVRTWLPLPPYSAVQIMTCTQDELLDICDEIVAEALTTRDVGVLLVFSCVARLRMLRERGHEEAARLQRAAGPVPVFGFYSYGELARTTSPTGIHNATVTAVAL